MRVCDDRFSVDILLISDCFNKGSNLSGFGLKTVNSSLRLTGRLPHF
jgi:hypothetical protein